MDDVIGLLSRYDRLLWYPYDFVQSSSSADSLVSERLSGLNEADCGLLGADGAEHASCAGEGSGGREERGGCGYLGSDLGVDPRGLRMEEVIGERVWVIPDMTALHVLQPPARSLPNGYFCRAPTAASESWRDAGLTALRLQNKCHSASDPRRCVQSFNDDWHINP